MAFFGCSEFQWFNCTKINVHGETLLKTVSAVGFSERKKKKNCENVSFHREIYDVTIFLLVPHICIVNAIILIKKH